jgi:hypothetical protein
MITRYTAALVSARAEGNIPEGIRNEADLERNFVVPAATRLVKRHAGVRVFNPWANLLRCTPDCKDPSAGQGRVEPGCAKCWARSKGWSAVAAFGTRHNFDLAVSDRAGGKLGVEVKFVTVKGGRMPSGEIQGARERGLRAFIFNRTTAQPHWLLRLVRGKFRRGEMFRWADTEVGLFPSRGG